MIEVEELGVNPPAARQRQFRWLLFTLIRPGKTLPEIARLDRPAWLLPLLILTLLTIVNVLVAGPLRQQLALNTETELPSSFEYMTPEQQEQYMQAQQSGNGPATTILFPAIGSLFGLWMGWFLLGSIVHLTLTLFGSRSSNTTAYNITAWASLPFAIRHIVQIVAMLATKQLINSPGISGFIAADAGQVFLYIQTLLRMVDFYLIWQIVLLTLGATATSGLTRRKTLSGILVSVVLLLLLSALPGFLSAQMGALNVTQSFIFF